MANVAINNQNERTVIVKRGLLLEQLIANKKTHLNEYTEAVSGYRIEAIRQINTGVEKARRQLETEKLSILARFDDFKPENIGDFSDRMIVFDSCSIRLEVPKDYSDKYQAAIDMMEWDTREEIELTSAEFQCFVRNVWDWSFEFENMKSIYIK